MALGRPAWTEARQTLQKLLSADEVRTGTCMLPLSPRLFPFVFCVLTQAVLIITLALPFFYVSLPALPPPLLLQPTLRDNQELRSA